MGPPLPWLPGRHSRPSSLTMGTWDGGQQGLDAEKRGRKEIPEPGSWQGWRQAAGLQVPAPRAAAPWASWPPRGRRMSHVFTRVPPSCQSILRAKRGACLPGDGGAGWRSGCGTYEPCETLGRFYAPVIRRQRGPRPWEFNGVTAGKCQPDPGLAGVPVMVRCSLGLRFPGCKMRGVAQVP